MNPASHALESKLAMTQGVISSHGLTMEKKIFSETMRPTFSMLQCLVVPYIDPANHDRGVQIDHTLGVINSPWTYNGKNNL